ncbi:Peroxidase [Thalictrum thalictroides]|uniref:Peroxidase n=1 Tax=Thalictrum thalictroides TaxID=46969 RepID=A0A7J6X0I5_THATH|nr:Peroxidase [Thalictrum thalictroides]
MQRQCSSLTLCAANACMQLMWVHYLDYYWQKTLFIAYKLLVPNQDPTMDQRFAQNLKHTCPKVDSNGTAMLDVQTPNLFDNRYYINLRKRQGLFTSDQDLIHG